MTYKPFSQKLYDENDEAARNTALDLLLDTGMYELRVPLEKQKEQFKKCDFEIFCNVFNYIQKIEVEVKELWRVDGKWQSALWETIDIPARKKDSEAHLFMMINKNHNTIAVTSMATVLKSNTKRKNTIYTENEEFFAVDVSKFKFYYKKKNKWRQVNGKR